MDAETRIEIGRKAIQYYKLHFNKEKILDKMEASFFKGITSVDYL
jgi:hypothetical protein